MSKYKEADLRVDITLHNNRLYTLIMDNFKSVRKFSEALNLPAQVVGSYINLKKSPLLRGSRGYRKTCCRIADFFFVDVVELFPLELYALKETEINLEMKSEHISFHECAKIPVEATQYQIAEKNSLKESIEKVLARLSPKQRKVIEMKYLQDCETEEIANFLHVTPSRIGQIEEKAFKRIRHPSFLSLLKDFSY